MYSCSLQTAEVVSPIFLKIFSHQVDWHVWFGLWFKDSKGSLPRDDFCFKCVTVYCSPAAGDQLLHIEPKQVVASVGRILNTWFRFIKIFKMNLFSYIFYYFHWDNQMCINTSLEYIHTEYGIVEMNAIKLIYYYKIFNKTKYWKIQCQQILEFKSFESKPDKNPI